MTSHEGYCREHEPDCQNRFKSGDRGYDAGKKITGRKRARIGGSIAHFLALRGLASETALTGMAANGTIWMLHMLREHSRDKNGGKNWQSW